MSSGVASAGGGAEREWERLARDADSRAAPEPAAQPLRELLTFELDRSPYAIGVERVREIIRLREIAPMPRVPDCVIGVLALRGEIVQVLDLRMRLGLQRPAATRRSRIIVLHGEKGRVTGVVVDAVQAVFRVSANEIIETAAGQTGAVSELCRRGSEFVSIVDIDHVLDFEGY